MNDPVVTSAGVDYITLTRTDGHQIDIDTVHHINDNVRRVAFGGQAGIETKPWGHLGYSGWSFGGWRHGYGRDGVIVTASGPTAQVVLESANWFGWRCTRVDAQVTVRSDQSPDDVIAQRLTEALLGRRAAGSGRPYKIRHVKGHGDGDTLYIGSRRSQIYVRIYNKHAESGFSDENVGCVRYEVEYKAEAAQAVFGLIVDARDIGREARSLVASKLLHYRLGGVAGVPVLPGYNIVSGDRTTDLDTQLLWLERSVKPLIKRLLTRGYQSDIMAALGLNSTLDDDASAPEQLSLL